MADKLTKKDLQAKIDALEKELYLYKNKTQLARNYSIVKGENDELQQKLHKKKEYWMKWAEAKVEVADEVDDDDDEDSE
tara:strand:- start:1009 stop:1245 length:237 start_codon:yes stop_codon:yes gene_type:complete